MKTPSETPGAPLSPRAEPSPRAGEPCGRISRRALCQLVMFTPLAGSLSACVHPRQTDPASLVNHPPCPHRFCRYYGKCVYPA